MAKRKAAGTRTRKRAGRTGAGSAARSRKKAARKSAAKAARKSSSRKAARPSRKAVRKSQSGKAARKGAARKATARKAGARKAPARKTAARAARRTSASRKPSARRGGAVQLRRQGTGGSSAPAIRRSSSAAPKKVPALSRARRTVVDEDIVPTPPSSLDLDRTASAFRTGRRELRERFDEHNETSPAITGGDVDADWESAYTVGDEAPGGDNPTPDQDIVDDIGRAVGVEYQDNEELKGEEKIAQRDRHRWELDPASSEDYEDR